MTSTSDEWLLALLDEKSPAELSAHELGLLQERARSSPHVRKALAERLRLEEALHELLGEPGITPAPILRQVRAAQRRRVMILCLAMFMLVAAGMSWWLVNREPDRAKRGIPMAANEDGQSGPVEVPDSSMPRSPRQRVVPVEAARPTFAANAPSQPVVEATPDEGAIESDKWKAELGDDAPVRTFEESAFAAFGDTGPGFDVADQFLPGELNRWIAAIPGRPFAVNEGQWRGRTFAGFDGIARLQPEWREDAVLRIAPFDTNEFALHFWNGDSGCTVRYYPHRRPQLLAAYRTSREGSEPEPKLVQLISTDSGAYARANAGALEFRHQDEKLVVTRGEIPLLVVPMASRPLEVLLEAKSRFRTLAMYRGEAAPLPATVEHASVLEEPLDPDRERLVSASPPGKVERSKSRITLTAGAAEPGRRQVAWTAFPLPKPSGSGLYEAIFRIESITPGAGLYLGSDEGVPVHTLIASENSHSKSPVLGYGWTSRDGNVPDPRLRWDIDPKSELAPIVGAGCWVKIVLGTGGLKVYFSGDGEHWGPAAKNPERAVRGEFASLGMFVLADGQPRSVSVTHIDVRELSGLATLADEALREQVPAVERNSIERWSDWMTWATATCPEGVDRDRWLVACGVETLARGASDAVSAGILKALVQHSIQSNRTVEQSLAVLHDAALLSDLWNDRARDFAGFYEELSRKISAANASPAETIERLTSVAFAYSTSPIWTESRMWALPPAPVRDLVANVAWAPSALGSQASRRVAFYLTPAHPEGGWSSEEDRGLARMSGWAASLASRADDRLEGSSRFGWRHPLATEPGREATTVAGELQTALDAGAYADAASLLATLSELPDLVPAIGDPSRYMPPAGLIAEVAGQHPELVRTLTEQFGPAALIRVRQAIAAGDELAVRLAALRYFGTPAAVEAQHWLGDAALAAGAFHEAKEHFDDARRIEGNEQQTLLAAKVRLAAALAGEQDSTSRIGDEPVAFGPRTLSSGEFETLIDEVGATFAASAGNEVATAPQLPKVEPVLAQPRGRFEGDLGRNPDRGEFRRFDWVGRQINVKLDRGIAYLNNRFQIVAFDLKRKTPWWTVGLGGEQGDAHGMPNVAFEPVVHRDRLIVRRLTSRGPELACLSLTEGGKVLWRSGSEWVAISDPVLDEGILSILSTPASNRGGGPVTISLTKLRVENGLPFSSTPLVILNQAEMDRPAAQLLQQNQSFLFVTQGTVGKCDTNGRLKWLRRFPYLPAPVDHEADRLAMSRPVIDGDRIYVALPGTRGVCCLDMATGRLAWSRPGGELEAVVGLVGDRLVVRTSNQLLGLAAANGEVLWSFERNELLEGALCGADAVLAASRVMLADQLDGLSLLRLDPATGELLSEQLIRVHRKEEIRCGPLFEHDGSLWGFVGEGWRDPKRTLVEFVADPSGIHISRAGGTFLTDEWQAQLEPQTQLNSAIVLPGWSPVGLQASGGTRFGAPLVDEHQGERQVLLTVAGRERVARFLRQLTSEKPVSKLVARVGREDDEGWTFRVLADGEVYASEPVNKETAPDGWRTVTLDLSPFKNKSTVLAVDQVGPADKPDNETRAYWKNVRLE